MLSIAITSYWAIIALRYVVIHMVCRLRSMKRLFNTETRAYKGRGFKSRALSVAGPVVAGLTAANPVAGQVVFVEVDEVLLAGSGTTSYDVDGDGIADLGFLMESATDFGLQATNSSFVQPAGVDSNFVRAFAAGESIGFSAFDVTGSFLVGVSSSEAVSQFFDPATNVFAGFTFILDQFNGGTTEVFAWADIAVATDGMGSATQAEVNRFAYEASGSPITTGVPEPSGAMALLALGAAAGLKRRRSS